MIVALSTQSSPSSPFGIRAPEEVLTKLKWALSDQLATERKTRKLLLLVYGPKVTATKDRVWSEAYAMMQRFCDSVHDDTTGTLPPEVLARTHLPVRKMHTKHYWMCYVAETEYTPG